jgi:hypothetical protein
MLRLHLNCAERSEVDVDSDHHAAGQVCQTKDKAYELRDTQTRGLILRAQPTGRKTYYCQAARTKRVKIGRADLLTERGA